MDFNLLGWEGLGGIFRCEVLVVVVWSRWGH